MKSENEFEVNDELIARYLAGEARPEEAIVLLDWIKQPDNRSHFQSLEAVWNASRGVKKVDFIKTKAWDQLKDSMNREVKMQPPAVTRWWTARTMSIAAALLVLLMAFAYFFTAKDNVVVYKTLATAGETQIFFLPDSSKVTLFRNTTLNYPVQFAESGRQVTLDRGQAFFEVTHDSQNPFLVHTPKATVKVLGTSFNVQTENGALEVSVRDGKVLVYNSTDSAYLGTGQRTLLQQDSKSFVSDAVVDVNNWGYATGKLVFKETPLPIVIDEIEKAYPCIIRIKKDDIKKCLVTATFEGDSIDKIVDLISDGLNLTVKRDGKVFILDGEGCP